ncbi:hypothetical protein LTR22_027617, partial [Elasticomyces elasticus]
MSGAEVIAAIQLIDACIGIAKTILDIGRAVSDAQGLPPKLRGLLERLPVIEELLESAHDNFEEGKVAEDTGRSAQPILQQCEQALGGLREIFRKACPKEGDNRSKRIWKGAKTVFFGRDSQVQKLLEVVQDSLKLLEQKEIYVIGDKLEELQELTKALSNDDSGKYAHTGAGHIVANEGGSPTNYFGGSGNSRQINNPGVYNEGPSTHTHKYLPPERADTPPEPTSNVPFRRDPDFVERGDLLDRISAQVSRPAARVAVVGLGGIGKSQLAIEYCYRLREQSRETWVLWIHASSAARFEQGVREIAGLVKIRGRDDPKANIFELVRDWLRGARSKWILVLDNVDDTSFLLESGYDNQGTDEGSKGSNTLFGYLPVCDHGSTLITTRSEDAAQKLVERSDMIIVGAMKDEDALRLLDKKLGDHADLTDTPDLAKELENMPLALTQAAAYLRQMGGRCSVRQYVETLRKSDRSKKSILDEDAGDLRRDGEARNAIFLTWQISFEHVSRIRPSAAELLSLMSFCDRQAIPEALVRRRDSNGDTGAGEASGEHNIDDPGDDNSDSADSDDMSTVDHVGYDYDDAFDKDIRMLEGYSFVSLTIDPSTFEMHRLVQVATRKWLKSRGQLEQWKEQYIDSLCALFPPGRYENWSTCQVYYPHVQSAVELKPKQRERLLQWAAVMYNAAWYAWTRVSADDAERMAVLSLKARTKTLGEGDEETLSSQAMVALAKKSQGRWDEAEKLQVQVMETTKKVLGAEHPDTLASMGNLASTYSNQGRWDDAEKLEVQVMETRKKVLGAEHPDTLTSMGNLALTYSNQGRWDEAEKLQVQ